MISTANPLRVSLRDSLRLSLIPFTYVLIFFSLNDILKLRGIKGVWRNGRRYGLKIRWFLSTVRVQVPLPPNLKGAQGSSPQKGQTSGEVPFRARRRRL